MSEILVEPVGLAGYVGLTAYGILANTGLIDILCHKRLSGQPQVNCSGRDFGSEDNEISIQKEAASWSIYISIAYLVPAAVVGLILGAWGDRIGRKFNMVAGLAGAAVSLFGFVLILSNPQLPLWLLLVTGLLSGLTGYIGLVPVSCVALISDRNVGNAFWLTYRIFYLNLCQGIGAGVTAALGSSLTGPIGLNGFGVVSIGIVSAGLLWTLVRVPQVAPAILKQRSRVNQRKYLRRIQADIPDHLAPEKDPAREILRNQSTAEEEQSQGVLSGVWILLRDSVKAYLQRREGHRRAFILLSALVFFLHTFVAQGSPMALYVQKKPFSWSESLYSTFVGVDIAAAYVMCTLVIMAKGFLRLSDPTTAAVVSGMICAKFVFTSVATKTWQIFAADALAGAQYVVGPCLKSFVIQLVGEGEVGKVMTIFGLALDLGQVMGTVVLNSVYRATLSSLPQAAFIVAAFVEFLCAILMAVVALAARKELSQTSQDKNVPETTRL